MFKIKAALTVLLLIGAGILAAPLASAQTFCWWFCPPPPPPAVTWTQVAADNFDRPGPDLGTNWVTKGAGTLWIENQEISGRGTPSVPTSYAVYANPTSTDQQDLTATVRWEGRNPAHSLTSLNVRMDPSRMGTGPNWSVPTGTSGVTFWFVDNLMGLDYEHPNSGTATNPSYFTPLPGTASYVNTAKFPEGAKIELKVTDGANNVDTYTALVNGKQVLQGTLSTSIVPRTQHYFGIESQDDGTASTTNGDPPANLDDFVASQGS